MNTAAKWFKNDPLLLIADGNHDTIILKRHETDLMERLHALLREGGNAVVHRGGFSGWVRFMFSYRSERKSLKLAYHHGYGGDAPVTKGTIQTNRMAVYLPDADFVCTGHTHNEWQFPIARLRLSDSGRVYHDEQLHLELPSYKDEYREGEGGWTIERGGPPKPIGAMWLRLFFEGHNGGFRIGSEITRASSITSRQSIFQWPMLCGTGPVSSSASSRANSTAASRRSRKKSMN